MERERPGKEAEVRSILSDWWGEQLFDMSRKTALEKLIVVFACPEVSIKPLAKNLEKLKLNGTKPKSVKKNKIQETKQVIPISTRKRTVSVGSQNSDKTKAQKNKNSPQTYFVVPTPPPPVNLQPWMDWTKINQDVKGNEALKTEVNEMKSNLAKIEKNVEELGQDIKMAHKDVKMIKHYVIKTKEEINERYNFLLKTVKKEKGNKATMQRQMKFLENEIFNCKGEKKHLLLARWTFIVCMFLLVGMLAFMVLG